MRARVSLLITFLISCSLLLGFENFSGSSSVRAAKTTVQVATGRGHFVSPSRGQDQPATIPFTIAWQLDNPPDIAYQDLNLSTDGGASFDIAIAEYLSPSQRRLTWSTVPRTVTPQARLQVILHGTDGQVSEIISDDFIISHNGSTVAASNAAASSGLEPGSAAFNAGVPQHGIAKGGVSSAADITNNLPPSGGQNTQTVTPDFPGSGSCASWNVPNVTLDYSMGSIYDKCGSLGFRGEPNVAQDPVDPTHFVLLHFGDTPLRAYEPNGGYAYSPHIKVGPFLSAPGYFLVGDISVEIAADGSVYAVQIARSQGSPQSDAVLIFRSTDGGLNFGNGVPLPKPAGVQFVDKPVMDVHRTNPNILAVTVNPINNGFFTGNAYVVICTSASTLSNFTVVQPLTNGGTPIKPYQTLHPLIDPISSGSPSYWLFLVYTNDDFSGGRSLAGMTIFQYQVTGSTLGHGGLPINSLIRSLPGSPPLFGLNPNYPSGSAIEKCLRIYDPRFTGNIGPGNNTKAAIDYCNPDAHRMYIPNHANSNGVSSDLYVTV